MKSLIINIVWWGRHDCVTWFRIVVAVIITLFGDQWLSGCFNSKCLWEFIVMGTVALYCLHCTCGLWVIILISCVCMPSFVYV